jgi:transposase InsO family protein
MLFSMDTSSFLNALVRFCGRRGTPEKLRSDQGTNFIGGENEMTAAIRTWNEDHATHDDLLLRGIKWEYNPPASSHMGGVWERQVRTVRKVMNSILREQVLDDERLITVFTEVESIVNSRPITSVSDDPKDREALIPNHLLLLRDSSVILPGKFGKEDLYHVVFSGAILA